MIIKFARPEFRQFSNAGLNFVNEGQPIKGVTPLQWADLVDCTGIIADEKEPVKIFEFVAYEDGEGEPIDPAAGEGNTENTDGVTTATSGENRSDGQTDVGNSGDTPENDENAENAEKPAGKRGSRS